MAQPTRQHQRRWTVIAAGALAAGVALIGLALGVNPASADTGSTAPAVSSTQEVQPEGLVNGPQGNSGDCTKDVCKRIHWCDSTSGTVKDDAPTVVVPQGSQAPSCVKRPVVKKVTCCEQGKGDTIVYVYNPNCFKLRVGVQVDSGTPEVNWINGGDTAEFKFDSIANGDHVIRASVWVKDGVWCNFAKLKLKVNCTESASPSPSVSKSASPKPSASPRPSHTHSASPSPSRSAGVLPPINHTGNNGSLPITGAPVLAIALAGMVLVAAGAGVLLYSRRRRPRAVRA